MRIFSRIGLISTFAASGVLPIAIASAQPERSHLQAQGEPHVSIRSASGLSLAIHFLAGDGPDAVAFIREYIKSRSSIAGIEHIFIHPGDSEEAKAWAGQFGDDAKLISTDAGDALALGLKLPRSAERHPATIVVDRTGREVFRHVGSVRTEHLKFDDFARKMTQATRPTTIDDYNLPKGKTLALEGYDPVAYFRLNKAVKGVPSLASTYRGVTYHFSTSEHRNLFAADPEKYLPTYGGWCATAMGDTGEKVEIDPKVFKVKDGRLFLFYKGLFANALNDWNKHESKYEPAADRNWKKLTGEDPIRPEN